MFDPLDAFKMSTWRRSIRIARFIATWLMYLLSASIELCLHRNFGRRYLRKLIMATLLFLLCAGVAPQPNLLTGLFLLILLVALAYHAIQIITRPHRGVTEPYTLSTGDPWLIGQFLKCSQTTVQRYIEPAVCFFLGLNLSSADPFLHVWLEASGVALFLKEQILRMKLTRRVLDSMDAKHEAQMLNASLKTHQPPPGKGNQRPHRAHLPHQFGQRGRRHP